MSHRHVSRALASRALLVLAAGLIAGCGAARHSGLVPDQRPIITISSGPIERGTTSYQVRLDWTAFDPDGYVTSVQYAVDPPIAGDTAWVTARQNFAQFEFQVDQGDTVPPLGSLFVVPGYHTVVLRAVDNDGAFSLPLSRSFTATTVAPFTTIVAPVPTHEVAISTMTSLRIQWRGVDPDGPPGQQPDHYAWMLARADSMNPANPNAITIALVQQFFGAGAANRFASWNTLPGSQATLELTGLTPFVTYYFAIVAFDEAGAFEPRFNGDTNVLAFRPTLDQLGPKITVFNAYFQRRQNAGGVSLDPSRIYPLQIPAGRPATFNWFADPGTQGSVVTGYRWALDLADSNVADSTVRTDPADVTHWTDWSPRAVVATVGPFAAPPGGAAHHLLYIEARDNFEFVSLYTLDLQPVAVAPVQNLLVVDDMYGAPTIRNATPPYVSYTSPYPMEAEQDSFYYAQGAFPDSLRILAGTPGAFSLRGSFADFAYDTLDYRAYPASGIAFAYLARYKVVAWYSDQPSATYNGAKFGSTRPMTALRFINSVNHENVLALYLALGGKVWLFGDGTTTNIANGYYSRIVNGGIPRPPYTAGSDPRLNILQAGDFLYDFIHLRSQVDEAQVTTTALTNNSRLVSCLPYSPSYALPAGQPVPADRSLDPRIGPSAQRTIDDGWGALPRLTLGAFRGATGSVGQTFVVNRPLFVTEGAGAAVHSVLDTLYLCMAAAYDPNGVNAPQSDGMPNALDYHGSDNGEVVWFGFPLYDFEPDQARQVVRTVLQHLGVPQGGDTGAHPFVPAVPPRP